MTEINIYGDGKYYGCHKLSSEYETANNLLSIIDRYHHIGQILIDDRFGELVEKIEVAINSDTFKIATIEVFNGGRYGKPEVFKALIEPSYFNNGKMKTTDFTIIKRLETLEKGYNFNNIARNSTQIVGVENVQNLLL